MGIIKCHGIKLQAAVFIGKYYLSYLQSWVIRRKGDDGLSGRLWLTAVIVFILRHFFATESKDTMACTV